ncbi:MAG: LemA family protein [Prolixibacteraceae bacterium]|jgi:LemA protein
MNASIIVILVIVFVIFLIFFSVYNNLTRKKNQVFNAFGTIDVQLKNRYDLIPNLVATVQQYTTHEKDLLTKITELRSKAMNSGTSPEEKVHVDNQISSSLSGLMVAVENYPNLKASENFINLQRTLNEVESQIAAARRTYNAAVTDYNNAIQMFPGNLLAGMMQLSAKEVFAATEAERSNVNVKNLFNS